MIILRYLHTVGPCEFGEDILDHEKGGFHSLPLLVRTGESIRHSDLELDENVHHKLASPRSRTSRRKSASCSLTHIGGENRIVCPQSPPLPRRSPISLQVSMICAHSSFAGSFDCRSFTSSIPRSNPLPRTSPMMLCLSFSLLSPARILFPILSEFA